VAAGLSITLYVSNASWSEVSGGDFDASIACSAATTGNYSYSVLLYKGSGNTNFYPEVNDIIKYNGNLLSNGGYYAYSGPGPDGLDVYSFGLNGTSAVASALVSC
jgi:hypothetical protein